MATLWFAFVVEQQVHPLLDSRQGDSGMRSQSTGAASSTGDNGSGTTDDITEADVVVSVALTLAMLISFGIALRFRELYREDDDNLSPMEMGNPKEESP